MAFPMDTFSNKSRQSPRPTIPYSQIRRPTPKLQTTFERQKGHDELDPESAGSRVSYDLAMETSPNGRHRRRRSSANGGGVGEARTSTSSLRDPDDFTDDDLDDDEETGLTQPLRDERSQRKARATHLDQRISPSLSGADGDGAITSEEKAEARASMVKRLAINGLLIGLWYLFSLSISIYNTWMFGHAHLDFKFPLFTTSVHMLVQFSLASLVLYLFPRFRPRHDAISNPEGYRPVGDGLDGEEEEEVLRTRTAEEKKPLMTRWFYLTRLGPCGMATGLDIGLGNTSLKFISLSFYTMCKSSSLAFVLLFAFLFRLETPSLRLVLIIATMTAGVILMVMGEVIFSPVGFMLVISAAFFSGFRWGLTQILLLRNPATGNPFASIFYLAPIMFGTLFLLALGVEGVGPLAERFGALVEEWGVLRGPLILLLPGIIAFCMTASEFALLQRTSVVTLSIAGIAKEVVTIVSAELIFEDRLTTINGVGLVVTIAAIAYYNFVKLTRMKDETERRVHRAHLVQREGSVGAESLRRGDRESSAGNDGGESDVRKPGAGDGERSGMLLGGEREGDDHR